MDSILEIIKRRISCRTYSDQPVEEGKKTRLAGLLAANGEGPFANRVRFHLLDLTSEEKEEVKKLGTYGVIKGARLFIAGTVAVAPGAMEDFGYLMERNILEATAMGLGTCWLGGTFKRSGFAGRIGVSADEVVPAITPVGYASDKRSLADRAFRFIASSSRRKPWEELFFDGGFETPLRKEKAGPFAEPLECVRLAPSASNRQPWRVLSERDGEVLHFFLERTSGYDRPGGAVKLQNIDMGIALCHFELAARELGLKGSWVQGSPGISAGQREYIASWSAEKSR